ncbi:long-chain fatty acid--CoA ligase [Sphingomonas morindae]|uniref:Long-chain fatty acid--CoA ligase n=1 Tax=Sphingomonas morindae TaxID=1541170 RepID=A0ABY4XC48_9SPHN|nr:long-chain fatty acid--CoA ligase [Sphingomonas morindae]USI74545.1 long-chain fatty acid--CoA ligase [Sphingomonas morindae]
MRAARVPPRANPAGDPIAAGPAPRLLTDLLDASVARAGDAVALDFMGATISYAELGRLVARAARGLQDLGVEKGTPVGLCLPNMPAYVILYFAIHRIGGVVVNINPLYTGREIEHLLRDSGARIVACCDVPEYHDKLVALGDTLALDALIVCPISEALPPLKRLLYRLFKRKAIARVREDGRLLAFTSLLASAAPADPVARDPDDVAVLQYTGGTTGVPKAAMLTHANLAANSAQMTIHTGSLDLRDERIMGVLPLFHVFALTTVLNHGIDTASTIVLLPRFEMKLFLATMKRTRCTELFAVPTIYGALNTLPKAKLGALGSLKFSISGGAPLPFDVRQSFEARTGCRVVEGYGLSEASPIITCNPLDGAIKDNSCGPAFPATVIEIRDLDDPGRRLPAGQRGEVCARGPQVMKGYWRRPDEDARVFVDGALRTGDVGYLDEDGYLFLVDRIKDVILCGGYNIYPRVIEEALYLHPQVREAVVIGIDDPYRGQAPKAFVTLQPDASVTGLELRDFLKTHINKLELPREIEVRDTLPKTLIGKLSKKELVAEERAKAGRPNG